MRDSYTITEELARKALDSIKAGYRTGILDEENEIFYEVLNNVTPNELINIMSRLNKRNSSKHRLVIREIKETVTYRDIE